MSVYLTPEDKARVEIDGALNRAGWNVQNYKDANLGASLGVVLRFVPLKNRKEADYVLFLNRKPVGVIEAKAEGTTLSGVAEQSETYLGKLADSGWSSEDDLRFHYESTGTETFFRDRKDPDSRSRRVFSFHRPETLQEWLCESDTLRGRLRSLPVLVETDLWNCQKIAIKNLEKSFSEARPKALIQMSMGSGKTYTAITFIYRLIKFGGARRVLFLVDRRTLGIKTKREFQSFATPDDGRKFTEIYNVQHLTSNVIDPVCRVTIATIQRVYAMLKGEEIDPELEDQSAFDGLPLPASPKEVVYNGNIPIEAYDFIVVDECHRSIYNLWRQVLEYFDSFLVGLTATPTKYTIGYFDQNLVMEYPHDRAVADGVNVGYDTYIINTRITSQGATVDAGEYVDKRHRVTRSVRWEQLDDDLTYQPTQLDRDVVAKDQIRTVLQTFKDKLFTDLFPGRHEVPKTLIFAKDDSHAEDITHMAREVFGKGNDFCKKITYRTYHSTKEKPEDLISAFRNSYNPRIAVTVDMISTGEDIKPLECLIFMRDVHSWSYFEQMKGRGTRIISSSDLQSVTPDATAKTSFWIIDAVGVCCCDKTESRPLEKVPSVSFEKLIHGIALGNKDDDSISSLAGRLAKMDREISDDDKAEIRKVAEGKTLSELIHRLLDAIDPDVQSEKAKELFNTDKPSEDQLEKAKVELVNIACLPFDNPTLRNSLIDIKTRNEQTIDIVTKDELIFAGQDPQAREKAQAVVERFMRCIREEKDHLTALQIIYNQPYAKRHLTYELIKELAEAIKKPPYNLAPELVWNAYYQLEQSKVRRARPDKLLTNIISLVRFAIGKDNELEPFAESVQKRFSSWITQHQEAGDAFTQEQREWLGMIRDHIVSSVAIEAEDFSYAPFHEKGGLARVHQLFGEKLPVILEELNEVLAA